MKWFPGSINEAVTTAKQRGAIFVVFIEGKDELSTEAARILERDEHSLRMDRADFVAVRVQEDAEAFDFFKQIYGSVAVPSLYFIGVNGAPLDVLSGDFAELSARLDAVLEKAAERGAPVASSSTFVQAEKTGAEEDAVEVARSGDAGATSLLPTEDKIERAKRLVELQRERKIELEREEEKKREIERRRTGKDVQALKRKQHETEVKLALDERMREKAADAEARERVLRQIAQDKLERKQREIALQQEVAQQPEEKDHPATATSSSVASGGNSTIARIQFRLPSGSPHLEKFDAASSLGALRSYVADNIELPFRQFTMSTTFPRRDLTTDEDEKTLTELELVPTAVILILPIKNSKITSVVSASTSDDVGFVSRFVWALLAPIASIYNYVMGYFTVAPTNNNNNNNNDNTTTGRSTPADRSANVNSPRLPARASYDQATGNILGGPSTTIRSRGNIHRLHSGGDENDENNTWNGNSTQQM